jgi:hypothetical protein
MKKSNKLLLGGFLAGLLLITAIHITLYAKYKNGDYTIYNPDDNLTAQSLQTFPNILFVSVRNVNGTVNFSDVAGVEKGEGEEENIEYVQKGDTLLITGRDSTVHQDFEYPVTFHLPYNATLSLFNSSLSFRTGKRMAKSNPVIYLQRSNALFAGTEAPLQFGHVKVVAKDSSAVLFYGNTTVDSLNVQLSNSSIEYEKGHLGGLSIITDSLSRISLQSKHLLKANIQTVNQQ